MPIAIGTKVRMRGREAKVTAGAAAVTFHLRGGEGRVTKIDGDLVEVTLKSGAQHWARVEHLTIHRNQR